MSIKSWLEQEYNGWHCVNASEVVQDGSYARFERTGTDTYLEVAPAHVQHDPVQAWNQFRALADKTDAKIGRAEPKAEPKDEAPATEKAKR
jgi:hypothetical protein